jgi:hypothetical protein
MTTMIESPPSASSTRAPTVARLVEAVVMVLCGLTFLATQLAVIGGLDLPRGAQIVPAFIAIGGIATAAWLEWRGVAGVGLIVALLSLWIAPYWISHAHQDRAKVATTLTFSNVGDSVRGAELFVNGVDLGPMPVQISKEELERRVPRWDKPPTGFDDKVFVPILRPQWESCWEREMGWWFAYDQPPTSTEKFYYQARYAGEIGVAPGFGNHSGGGSVDQTFVGFLFPQRDRRLQTLLNQARLSDYHVSADWFRALETFDEDGWLALRRDAVQEPGMDEVLTQWARWKYNLDDVHSAVDAWDALQRVCREADDNGVYLTPGVAGRAVEILARQVDPDQLVRACAKVIADTSSGGFVMWKIGQQVQFGTADAMDKMRFVGTDWYGNSSDEQGQFYGTSGNWGALQTPGKLVIAHALAEMWKAGIAHEKIQSEIGPDLLAWHYDSILILPLILAAEIGGPQVDAFLLAQPWQRTVTFSDREMTVFGVYPGGDDMNRWLYLLAQLNDLAGEAFRHEHATEILDMAGKQLQGSMIVWDSQLDYLLQDHDLAWKFWPRFRDSFSKNSTAENNIRLEYTYLQKMNAPASAYIDLWKTDRPGWQAADQAFGVLRFNSSPERAVPIASALLDYFQHDPHAMDQITDANERQYLINCLRKTINPDEQFMVDIRKYTAEQNPDRHSFAHQAAATAALWLSGPAGLTPIVKELADAPEPALRILSLGAIRSVSVASNRQLLNKLLSDPDPGVQREARSVDAELKALAAQSPSQFASGSLPTTQP